MTRNICDTFPTIPGHLYKFLQAGVSTKAIYMAKFFIGDDKLVKFLYDVYGAVTKNTSKRKVRTMIAKGAVLLQQLFWK